MTKIKTQIMTAFEEDALAGLLGKVWYCLSGKMMASDEFAWSSLVLTTTESSIEISLPMETMILENEIDSFPRLTITPIDSLKLPSSKSGDLYFHNKGETLTEIWVVRDTVNASSNNVLIFSYQADIAVAFKIGETWLGISRTSHIMDAFNISRVDAREDIKLPDAESEWEADLLDEYSFERTWRRIESNQSSAN